MINTWLNYLCLCTTQNDHYSYDCMNALRHTIPSSTTVLVDKRGTKIQNFSVYFLFHDHGLVIKQQGKENTHKTEDTILIWRNVTSLLPSVWPQGQKQHEPRANIHLPNDKGTMTTNVTSMKGLSSLYICVSLLWRHDKMLRHEFLSWEIVRIKINKARIFTERI